MARNPRLHRPPNSTRWWFPSLQRQTSLTPTSQELVRKNLGKTRLLLQPKNRERVVPNRRLRGTSPLQRNRRGSACDGGGDDAGNIEIVPVLQRPEFGGWVQRSGVDVVNRRQRWVRNGGV
ncbi:hypothetical protein FEM48_Zijuj03G0062700 [Ziziphus jujuba var. spinosa]|uniref:Uncharacterized protein n=1 Tax=Ziziphus jujuba var. spinosa TaxID=714518 RepID=A0A978VNN7_ZIZJJ|nr:hypothetical protein FEM48_Zijuj03G0062700 [Ziziphus jujuba var. spinosa]